MSIGPRELLFLLSVPIAYGLAVLACPLVIALSTRFGLLDRPGGRRHHPEPVPRPGGLALAFAFGTTIGVFWIIDEAAGGPFLIPPEIRSPRFTLVAFAAVVGMVVGFVDDWLDLRARWQFLGYLVIAAIVVSAGVVVERLNDPLSPQGVVELAPAVAVGFTVFWIVGMNIALNFIDGLDGLAAGVSAIAAFTLGGIALTPQISEPFVAWMAFTLGGALIGFLRFNFHPARLFLGTTGVAFVGTVLAVLAIFGTSKVAAMLLILGVPIIDTFYVLVRRVAQGRAPFAADRGHFHHRLLDVGLTHRRAVLLIYAITLAFSTLAVLTSGTGQLVAFLGLVVAFGVAVVFLAQRSTKAGELDPDLYDHTDE